MRISTYFVAFFLLNGFIASAEGSLRNHPTRGIVVASTRLDPRCGTFAGLISIEDAGHKHAHVFLLSNHFVPKDFHDPPGYFIAQEFEAGEWHFLGVRFGGYISDFTAAPGITFQVAPGKAIYLGQLFVRPSEDCKTYSISVSDEWGRDSLLYEKKSRDIPADGVTKNILSFPSNGQN